MNAHIQLRVFRPFFIRLNLPYSVKRGEKFALQVLVFNYMDREQDVRFLAMENWRWFEKFQVTLTLKHTEDAGFDFLNKDGSVARRYEYSFFFFKKGIYIIFIL